MNDSLGALELWVDRLGRRTRLGSPEVESLLALAHRRESIAKGRDLVRQGEAVEAACLVASGTIGRFKQNRDGLRQLAAIYIKGDMSDLHSVVMPISATELTALQDSVVLRIDHHGLRELACRSPLVAEAFWRDTTVDANIATERVFALGRLSALSRIAHLLSELSVRHEAIGDDPCAFPLHMSQVHIAEATGLTSVHVNRMFRELRERGLVEVTRLGAVIHDRAQLAKIGQFSPDYLHLPQVGIERRAEGTHLHR